MYIVIASCLFSLFPAKLTFEFLTSQCVLYIQSFSHNLICKRFPLEEFLFTDHLSLKYGTGNETWVGLLPGAIFLRVMRPSPEVDHSPFISGEVRSSTPSVLCLHGARACSALLFYSLDPRYNVTCHVNCINPLNPELNRIRYLLALLGAHHFLHVSRIRVKLLTFRRLMSYIYIYIYIYMEHPFLNVSRSHTTTQHSR